MMNAIKNRWQRLRALAILHEGIVLFVGCSALILGVLVDVFVLRLICLAVVLGSSALIYVSLQTKHFWQSGGSGESNSLNQSQSESDEMKKLVFDDFQPDSGGRYVIEEVAEAKKTIDREVSGASQPEVLASGPKLRSFSVIKPETKPVIREFQVSDFFDVDAEFFKGGTEPRTEFNFLLTKVLTLIKEVAFAHSVVFFWANREKEQLVMEARVTDSASFMTSRRFSIGHDIVSKIADSGKPELITDVNPDSERELLRYYDAPSDIKSFIGVPVFYSTTPETSASTLPVGVIAVDSSAEGAFGEETLANLGQFTKLVSGLIKSYTDKYDLLLDSELLSSLRRIHDRLRTDFSQATILQALGEETSKLVSWDFLSIVLYDETKHSWTTRKVVNRSHEGYVGPEQSIDFPNSIVGQVIKNNGHLSVETFETAPLPRYFKNEQGGGKGSFVSIPISSLNKCYGALNVESLIKFNYSRKDIDVLCRLAESAASVLEILYMNEIIQEYVIIDDVTGVYSKKFFMQRMGEELQRADDAGTELSFLMATVDHSPELLQRFGQEGFDRVMSALANTVRSCVRPYDLVGRFDQNRFGMLLINTAANDAYLWAEKIRKNVAAHVINFDEKSFSITISIGVCGALEGMRREELIGNTVTVLHKALETGGNAVRVF